MLIDQQINFYRKNGYLIVKNIFTDKEALEFNQLVRRHTNKDFAALINPDRFEQLAEQDERPKSDIRLEEITETASYSLKIMKNLKIVSILEALQKREVVGLSTQFIFKEAYSVYSSQAWKPHQDSSYPGDKNGHYITSNWFLRGADVENGSIYIYPGSHQLGLLDSNPQISYREKVGTNPGSECKIPEEYINKKIDLIIPKNSVLFLHGHCVHGSYPNNSNRSRPWFSCCYISKGEKYFPGKNAKRKDIELK